ncbi:MAG: hypothetical protein ACM3RP_07120 [Chitinophagales bacterium]
MAAGALDSFKERLQAIETERQRTFAALGDQMKELQKQLVTAQAQGNGVDAAKIKQQLVALTRPAVEAQRDALAEMAKDVKLSDDQYMEVKRRQYQVEQELRNLDVAAHKAAEEQKVAATRQAEQQQTEITKQEANARQELRKTATEMAAVGVAAGVPLAAVKKVVDESVDAFTAQQRSMAGLTAMANAYGQSVSAAKEAARSLTADGLLPLNTAIGAMRDLLTTGLNIDQAATLLEIFKNRASVGRAETLSLDQAVSNLAQSFKTEQSRLGDLSGMTENYSMLLEVGARAMGKNVNQLTEAERTQAKYLGIVQVSQGYMNGAASMANTLSAAQARLATTTTQAEAALGKALAPAVQGTTNVMAGLMKIIGDWVQVNPTLARGIVMATTGALGLAAALGALAAAVVGLNLALGPTGWLVAGITAAVGAMGGMTLAAKATADAARQTAVSTSDLIRQYDALRTALDNNTLKTDEKTRAQQKLKDVTGQLIELQPQMRSWFDEEGKLLDSAKGKYEELANAMLKAAKSQLALEEMQAQKSLSEIDSKIEARKNMNPEWVKNKVSFGEFLGALVGVTSRDKISEQNLQDWELQGLQLEADRAAILEKLEALRAKVKALESPLDVKPLVSQPPGGSGDGLGSGSSQMSAALSAALEDLQDLQALDKTPENLRKTLEKVREILKDHGAELAKLGRDRDLIRLRDIVLPKEITAAEFQEAMRSLQNDEQIAQAKGEPLPPSVIKERIQAIKQQFADYLAANPDQAAAIDVRLAGIGPQEIRDRIQKALDAIEQQKKLFGDKYSPAQEKAALESILPLTLALPGAEGQKQFADIIGRINTLAQTIQQTGFDEKMKSIADNYERAAAAAAPALASLQKQLIDEEAKGDKADPNKVKEIKEKILTALRPALEAERDAYQALLQDASLSADQRAQVERELNQVNQTLYSQDVDAYRLASEAKTAAARQEADRRSKVEQDALKALDKAEKDLLDATKARHKAEEDAIQRIIDSKQQELDLLERQYAAEDRLKKIQDARQMIADLQHSGEREKVLTAQGTWEERIKGMDEAQKALADAQQEDERARRKEDLQDQIQYWQDRLRTTQDANREEEQSIQDHFQAMKDLLTDGFEQMKDAQGDELQKMADSLNKDMSKLLAPWENYVSQVKALLSSIAVPTPGGTASTGTSEASTGDTSADVYQAVYVRGEDPDTVARQYGFSGQIKGKSYLNGVPQYGEGAYFPGNRPHLAIVGDSQETMVKHGPEALRPLAAEIAKALPMFLIPTIPSTHLATATTRTNLATVNLGGVTVNVGAGASVDPGAVRQAVVDAFGAKNDVIRAIQRGMIQAMIENG